MSAAGKSVPAFDEIDATVTEVAEALTRLQRADGHWLFELEADCTIPAEYVLLHHFLGEEIPEEQRKIATYLRARQSARHGGWPLFEDGDFDISASVKC